MAEEVLASATGRRKTSIARVRVQLGTGQIRVNGKAMTDYFPRVADQLVAHQALELTKTMGRYDVTATIHGGGISGQASSSRICWRRSSA